MELNRAIGSVGTERTEVGTRINVKTDIDQKLFFCVSHGTSSRIIEYLVKTLFDVLSRRVRDAYVERAIMIRKSKGDMSDRLRKMGAGATHSLAAQSVQLDNKAKSDPIGVAQQLLPREIVKYFNFRKGSGYPRQEKFVPFRGGAKNIGLRNAEVPIDSPPLDGEQAYANELWKTLSKYYQDVSIEDLVSDSLNEEKQRGYFQYANFATGFGRAAGPVNLSDFEQRTKKYNTFQVTKPNVDEALFYEAMEILKGWIKPQKLRALSNPTDYKAAYADKISNVGLPFAVKSSNLVNYEGNEVTAQEATSDMSQMMVDKYGTQSTVLMFIPALRATRSQSKGLEYEKTDHGVNIKEFKTSTRTIFMGPRIRNNIEFMIVKPIVEHFKQNKGLMAGYLDKGDRKEWFKNYHALVQQHGAIPENIDFSQFDTTVQAYCIVAVGVLLESFCSGQSEISLLWKAVSSLLTQGLLYHDSETSEVKLFFKFGTIPSGVTLTNLMGCLVNQLVTIYGLLSIDYHYYSGIYYHQGSVAPQTSLGDDMLCMVKSHEHAEMLAKILLDTFGMKVNPDKGTIGIMFLQELYVPSRDAVEYRLAGTGRSLLGPETSDPLGTGQTVIAMGAILSNACDTPGIVETIEYIKSVDKTRLGTEYEGKKLTSNDVREMLVSELKQIQTKQGVDQLTLRTALRLNNPVYDQIFDDQTGDLKSTGIEMMLNGVNHPTQIGLDGR